MIDEDRDMNTIPAPPLEEEEDTGSHAVYPVDPHLLPVDELVGIAKQTLEMVTAISLQVRNLETNVDLVRLEMKLQKSEMSDINRRIDELDRRITTLEDQRR